MWMTFKELEELTVYTKENSGDEIVLGQLEEFLANLQTNRPKPKPALPVGCPFNNDEWELVRTYDFKKRISFIYRHKATGEEKAWDELRKGEIF